MNLSAFDQGPKTLFVIGLILIVSALLWQFSGKWIKLGQLPGDIAIERENFKFYFPLATSILLSLILSLGVWLWRWWQGR